MSIIIVNDELGMTSEETAVSFCIYPSSNQR